MKVAGIKMTDPWASRALRSKGIETQLVSGAPVETIVQMERVSIEHHGSEKNYRPLLHLTGELVSIQPAEALPHGVEEVTFRSGLGPVVDAFYEFDDVQLAQLVRKGYFTEGFEAPAAMAGTPWELPTTIDALVLSPESEDDTPVVFVHVHGQTELALNLENSGYDLAEYFENHLTAEAQQERELENAPGVVPTRSGEINDLFAADEFTMPSAGDLRDAAARLSSAGHQLLGEYPVVRASIFEDLMAEIGDKLPSLSEVDASDDAPVDHEDDAEATLQAAAGDGLADSIYRDRIVPEVTEAMTLPGVGAPGVEDTAPAAPGVDPHTETEHRSEAPAAEPGLLDLYEEEEVEELGVAPVATAPAPVEAPQPQHRAQSARAHDLALDLTRDDSDEPALG